MIGRLHWSLVCGGEGGDLNDVLYTVKGLGMVVSTDVAFDGAPAVMNGFSSRWQSVFGGGTGAFAVDGEDSSYSGVHARSAIGGFTGRFSIEPELIVAIPPELAKAIIQNPRMDFPLPPREAERIRVEYERQPSLNRERAGGLGPPARRDLFGPRLSFRAQRAGLL